jgi:hypothetical protein
MKSITTILLIAIFTLFSMPADASGKKGKVSIQIHNSKAVPGARFKIKFVEMVEDSRCPTGTSCIWAGNAKVKIEVRGSRGGSKTFEINSATQPTVVNYSGYEIKLTGLTPHPAANIRINPDKYLATFEVTKTKGK